MIHQLIIMTAILLALQSVSYGGMPSPLPEDLPTYLRLNEEPHERFQAISFFLVGILLSSAAVMFLWNSLARDITVLPKLTIGKAFAIVILWGLVFVLVLTMISGARELMTPGAWKKTGVTYSLDEESSESSAEVSNAGNSSR